MNLCSTITSDPSCDGSSTNEGLSATLTLGLSNSDNNTFEDHTTFQLFVQPASAGGNDDTFQADDSANCVYGFCSFRVFPGDKKIYLDGDNQGIVVPNNFPNTNYQPVQFKTLRLYFAKGTDFDNVTPSSSFVDFELVNIEKLKFKTSFVRGLENDTSYVFRAASVDSAHNVLFFTPNSSLSLKSHSARPSAVYGLLDNNSNCFIASATFGSKWSPQVETFREFRDRFLHPTHWGRKFTAYYYKHSPYWAKQIQKYPALKFAAQIVLWPLWALLFVFLGGAGQLVSAVTVYFLFFGLIVFFLIKPKSHKKKHRNTP